MTAPHSTIAIVGGGTSGWMTAAALSKTLSKDHYTIKLIESKEIPTVGVGEATIPPIESFNKLLGIDRNTFIKETGGTFKLGIEFLNWGNIGDSYYHPFGSYGADLNHSSFYSFWQRARHAESGKSLEALSLNIQMAKKKRFILPQDIKNSPLSKIQYAYHFDASRYAQFLRKYAENRGVERIEASVTNILQNTKNGYIKTLQLDNQKNISADFFIDCTGFKGLLIEDTLKTGYESWNDYLPCDRAKAVASEPQQDIASHTKAIAHGFGWQWKIPLQHRLGNGLVYSSNFWNDQSAENTLLANLETPATADVRQLRFRTGRRLKFWNKNCIAIGLSSGFLEPLESTSIHLIQSAISKFISLLPRFNENFDRQRQKYNQLMQKEIELVRDFIILHYKATQRDDTAFWRYCKNMAIPTSLEDKIETYRSCGYLSRDDNELFSEGSWLSVLEGQGIHCQSYSPLADQAKLEDLMKNLDSMEANILKCVDKIPKHAQFVAQCCDRAMQPKY